MSLNKGKSAAPGVGGCNAMKGLTTKLCPAQTEKNARDCLNIARCQFSLGQQEVGIRLYQHRASRMNLHVGYAQVNCIYGGVKAGQTMFAELGR